MAIHSARRGRGIRSMALYPTWSTSKAAGAPVHCTGDDIMIASLVLLGALLIVGDPRRLQPRFHAVAAVAILGGPAYTVFSERSEEHTSELQSLMRISYAVFCLQKN